MLYGCVMYYDRKHLTFVSYKLNKNSMCFFWKFEIPALNLHENPISDRSEIPFYTTIGPENVYARI